MINRKIAFTLILLTFGLIFSGQAIKPVQSTASIGEDFDENRVRLLTYVVRRQIENHFSAKAIDDQLSKAAFDLYLNQLDFQKRLLLASEVQQLRKYEKRIDDEMTTGRIELAPFGAQLIKNGVERAQKITEEILAEPFDFSIDEEYETDPEKLEFCRNTEELRERWRTELKFSTLTRYLNLLADNEAETNPEDVPADKKAEYERNAREKVTKQYHGYFERLRKETTNDHYDRYLNAFARAFDPHSSYLPPQSKEDFDISMRGSLEGIGATLREEDGYIKVVKVIPGSAADRQGQLHADDVILAVGEAGAEPVDITDMRLRDAVSLIRGKKGTEVRLTVRRAGLKPFVIPIVRDIVVIEESFVKWAIAEDPATGQNYGYILIPSFYRDFEKTRNGEVGRNSTDDVKAALQELSKKKISGLILDLRNNGGGALTDAVGVTGLFIEKGPVVQVRDGSGETSVLYDHDPYIGYNGPMVVLVNQFSASASEIVAGALQDYRRALIVGSEHTHGKGTVQIVMDLDRTLTLRNMRQYMPLGALKMTTQKFYRVSGDSTQYRGVVPDIVLPDRSKYNKFGERYLDYSLPWDAIPAVEHADWSSHFELSQLESHSRDRVSSDEDFSEIIRLSEIIGERIENTRQSLQINQVFNERDQLQGEILTSHDTFGLDSADNDSQKSSDNEEDLSERQKLIRQITEDPYTRESMAILNELVASETKVAEGSIN